MSVQHISSGPISVVWVGPHTVQVEIASLDTFALSEKMLEDLKDVIQDALETSYEETMDEYFKELRWEAESGR